MSRMNDLDYDTVVELSNVRIDFCWDYNSVFIGRMQGFNSETERYEIYRFDIVAYLSVEKKYQYNLPGLVEILRICGFSYNCWVADIRLLINNNRDVVAVGHIKKDEFVKIWGERE